MEQVSKLKVGLRGDGRVFAHFPNGIYMAFTSLDEADDVASALVGLLSELGYYQQTPDDQPEGALPKTQVRMVLGQEHITLSVHDKETGDIADAHLSAAEVSELVDSLERAETAQFGNPLDDIAGHVEAIEQMDVTTLPPEMVPEFVEEFVENVVAPFHEAANERANHQLFKTKTGALTNATADDFEKKDKKPN